MDNTKFVQIDLNNIGMGRVIVGGVDMSRAVKGITLVSRPGKATQITLELSAHAVSVNAPAEVKAIVADTLTVNEARTIDAIGGDDCRARSTV